MSLHLIGQQLGKYKITELIGRGGMATVYKGYQADVDRFVAIKVLQPQRRQDPQYVERFRREVVTIARLQHPHILPMYDFGAQDNILYFVTAYISGGSLSDRIRTGPIPSAEVDRLLHQLASALDYAHRQGIIHRDVKPANILLDAEGNALLTDFGIAKIVALGGAMTGRNMLGTPAYMSPEQAQGMPVDTRSDIYSLGVVVYEMLTGSPPFTGETAMQIAVQHIHAPPPSVTAVVPNLSGDVDNLVKRVLAKSPSERPASATLFASELTSALHMDEEASASKSEAETKLFASPLSVDSAPTIIDTGASPLPLPVSISPQAPLAVPLPLNARPVSTRVPVILGASLIGLVLLAVLLLAMRGDPAGGENPTTVQVVDSASTSTSTSRAATPLVAAVPPADRFGSARFSTVSSVGDTVSLTVDNMAPPPAGNQYAVWLAMPDRQRVLSLGPLHLDALGTGLLRFTDQEERVLPAVFSELWITQEENSTDEPTGPIVYQAKLLPEASEALRLILVESERGINGQSLLSSLQSEAVIGWQHAVMAADATNLGGLQAHAEHTINVLLGTQEDYNRDGRRENPGHGEGATFFLNAIVEQLDSAAHAPGASSSLQAQIELGRTCIHNTQERITQLVELQQTLLAGTNFTTLETEKTRTRELAEQLIQGHDLNGNGQIEPFEGECGIEQISDFGVAIGTMDILAVSE